MDSSSEIDVNVRQEQADEAGIILQELAAAIRSGTPNRFHVSVKPLFDEFWALAKFVADHED